MNDTPSYFPITLRIDGARIVIIGGGKIAARKIRFFLHKNCHIDVFANALCNELKHYHKDGLIHFHPAIENEMEFQEKARNARLIFITTDDHAYNQQISQWAQLMNIPVCTVDAAEFSTFITPAIIDRNPVQIAISTGGAAPVLGRRLREKIEPLIGQTTASLALFIGHHREWAKKILPNQQKRQRLWERFLDGRGTTLIEEKQEEKAFSHLQDLVASPTLTQGEVWLIGAGPGDPDLLTLKALHYLQNADVILYDNLLSEKILNYIRRDALLIFAGKQKNNHTLSQDAINQHLVTYAQQGKRVLRLKGGDPFIFGRGGEEAEALMKANIPFRIIPGVSAANGCATYAGIPLTHRDCAQRCLILTGHTKSGNMLDLPWHSMIEKDQTLVIYMGLSSLPTLCATLIAKGLDKDWPAAAIEKGTYPDQNVITGTLETLPTLVSQSHCKSPVLILVGQVINHRVLSP